MAAVDKAVKLLGRTGAPVTRAAVSHLAGVLLAERNQLLGERTDLARRLEGARANVSRRNERRVIQLFPDGPGRTTP